MGIPDAVIVEMGVRTHNDDYIKYPVPTPERKLVWRYRLISDRKGERRFYWDSGTDANQLMYIPRGFAQAVKDNDGLAYIANGESSLWVYMAAGIRNVFAWFGETIIPKNFIQRVRKGGVRKMIVIPDADEAGVKMSQGLLQYMRGKKIYLRILSWGDVANGYDARDLWLECEQDPQRFRDRLSSLYPIAPPKEKKEYPPEVKEDLAYRMGVDISTANKDGWCKNTKCIFHVDKKPSAAYNITTGVLHCFAGCGSKNIREVADRLGVDISGKSRREEKGEVYEGGQFADFICSSSTQRPIKNSLPNAFVALGILGADIQYRWEVSTSRPMVKLGGDWQVAVEHMIVSVKGMILDRLAIELANREIHEAVVLKCKENQYEPISDHIENLPEWDGVERNVMDYIRVSSLGYDDIDKQLDAEVFRVLIRGMLARALSPGCKFDYCLVLEGAQGIGKSTFFEILAGDDLYGSDTGLARADGRKPIEKAQGKWLVEDAEFVESGSVSQQSRVKARLTAASEKERMAYERYAEDYSKRHVIVATTNQPRFLADVTGGRRYHIVHVTGFDLVGFRENRDQIMSEHLAKTEWQDAHHLQLHGDLEKRMRERQVAVQLTNGIQDVIEDWFVRVGVPDKQECWIQANLLYDWLRHAVSFQQKSKTDYSQMSDTMMRLGFRSERKRVHEHGNPIRVWIRGYEDGILLNEDELLPPYVTLEGRITDQDIPKHWKGDYTDWSAPPARGERRLH